MLIFRELLGEAQPPPVSRFDEFQTYPEIDWFCKRASIKEVHTLGEGGD